MNQFSLHPDDSEEKQKEVSWFKETQQDYATQQHCDKGILQVISHCLEVNHVLLTTIWQQYHPVCLCVYAGEGQSDQLQDRQLDKSGAA